MPWDPETVAVPLAETGGMPPRRRWPGRNWPPQRDRQPPQDQQAPRDRPARRPAKKRIAAAAPLLAVAAAIATVVLTAGVLAITHVIGPPAPAGAPARHAVHHGGTVKKPAAAKHSGAAAVTGAAWRSPVYVMPIGNNAPTASDFTSIMRATGEKDFLFAFVLDAGGCTPAWEGSSPVASDTAVGGMISAVRGAGGDAGVSFGGYNGTELAQSCGSASALAAAYQAVITKYQLTHIDFSIENTALGDTATELMRFQAIATLEREDPHLTVSLTTPVAAAGLPATVIGELQQATAAHARIDVVNLMDFDYPIPGSTEVFSDEAVAEGAAGQLESLFGWSAVTAWSHIGLTLMNGQTDVSGQVFTTSDFTTLLAFARHHHVAWLSYWSLNRDQSCPAGTPSTPVSGTCSSVSASPGDFTRIVARYAG